MRMTWLQPVVIWYKNTNALVAQLDRVLGYEPSGHRFESCRVHQTPKSLRLTRAFCCLGFGFFLLHPLSSNLAFALRPRPGVVVLEFIADLLRFAGDAFDVLLSHAVTMRWVMVFREGRSRRSLHFWTVVCFLSRISRRIFMDQDRVQVYLATACFQPRFFNV